MFRLIPTIKLMLVHSLTSCSNPFFVVVFGIFLSSSLHISDWAIGPSKRIAFLKVLICAWSRLPPAGHVLLLSMEASLPHFVSSASLSTLFLSHVLQRSFFDFLSHHYSHRITVFKVAKDHSLFGPPLWYARFTREALMRYDDSVS